MTVTEIKPVNSKKSKVYIDEEFAFVLYKGEMRRYHLAEGQILENEVYHEIMQEVLLKRGKTRALHLLESMNRTEAQLRSKLIEGGYPLEIIELILEYVKEYQYIDDSRYVSEYLRTRGGTKSFRQMTFELQKKGISKEVVQEIANKENSTDESETIRRWTEKKHIEPERMSREEIWKFCQFLLRKGFRYEDIKQELKI